MPARKASEVMSSSSDCEVIEPASVRCSKRPRTSSSVEMEQKEGSSEKMTTTTTAANASLSVKKAEQLESMEEKAANAKTSPFVKLEQKEEPSEMVMEGSSAKLEQKESAEKKKRTMKAKASPSVKMEEEEEEEEEESSEMKENAGSGTAKKPQKEKKASVDKKKTTEKASTKTEDSTDATESEARFIGNPIKKEEAMRRWPDRYRNKKKSAKKPLENSEAMEVNNGIKKATTRATVTVKSAMASSEEEDDQNGAADCAAHYSKAQVDGTIFELGNCVHVNSGDSNDYIGQIVEMFEDVNHECWFTAQWFFLVQDTAIKDVEINKHDKKRVFCSEVKDVNPLDCLVSIVKIVRLSPLHHFNVLNPRPIPPCDYYYDMGYDYAYSRFYSIPADSGEGASSESDITNCCDVSLEQASSSQSAENEVSSGGQTEYTLLDLYSGCGGMSTGLSMGANLASVKLVAKWALDLNPYACQSLEYNHPETQVRNESAEDFLILLKEWKKLCDKYAPSDGNVGNSKACGQGGSSDAASDSDSSDDESENSKPKPGEFEVERILGIRYVSASESGKAGIEMKIRWKGYGPSDDTWEPISGLGACEERIKKFVIEGKRKKILPMQGDVDVVCGGPPCQGASGFNRFRNREDPLADARNKQIIVYMDIVDYLKPRFVLMENVVDIVRFADGLLGRYALHRLVQMHYQAMLGMMVAGCFGLPQFRMRVFLWGAAPTERLPPYPLPTHDVVQKGGIPQEWERNIVAYEANSRPSLCKALTLGDALKDLPPVENSETRDEMSYGGGAQTDFQRFIRLPKDVLTGASSLSSCKEQKQMLHDHLPLMLNNDDYQRVCRIPKKKGANFRSLPGVIVREDNTVALDPAVERVLLPSGKPLVPDYAITFVKGRSPKPFGRLWWDETVPTVVTRAEPHNQAILHPEQDRVLTIRENARLQGFPDYYKLFGPVKQRYTQVGNAVAVPVGRALGYSLGLAIKQSGTLPPPSTPVIILPPNFPQGLMANSQQITSMPLEVEENEGSAA